MKVKNLLLAGLAVAAMTACSNDIEGVDNSIQNDGTAFMQLSFDFPKTRATVTDGTDDQGIADEYNVQTVDVKLVYDNGTVVSRAKLIKDFNVENNGQTLILKNVEEVPAGTITEASAVLNKGSINLTGDWATTPITTASTGLGYLANGIAQKDNFLMSGKNTTSVTFNEGETSNVTIPVSRVSAKLDEATKTTEFTISSGADQDAQINEAMTITLSEYSYGNLTQKTYLLDDNSASVLDNQSYNHPYGTVKTAYEYKAMDSEDVVYCMENATTTGLTSNSTYVLYKATVEFDGVAPTAPFYVWNKTIYKTLAELKAANVLIGDAYDDKTSQADYLAVNVYKYEDGECFYMTEIDNATDNHKVVRNTWYKLDVQSIAKLGYPTPDVPPTFEDKAFMNLKITVTPWKVKFNAIHF